MDIKLIPAPAVPELFAERLENRQDDEHVLVTSMSLDLADNPISESLLTHGQPDDVVAIDAFGHVHGPAVNLSSDKDHRQLTDNFEQQFPGSYQVLGRYKHFEWFRVALFDRSHIKTYMLGNRALAFGGVNCTTPAYGYIDMMLDFESDAFASFTSRFIENGGNLRYEEQAGERFWLDDRSEVLVDYGRRGESIIMDSLLEDLDQETSSVRVSSSYVPQGRLDRNLSSQASDGSEIFFYANHPSKFGRSSHSPFERIFNGFNAFKAQTEWVDNNPDQFIHLKAAIITLPDGSKIAYALTNTMTDQPVNAGTAELGLRTTDPELIGEIEAFMIDNLDPDTLDDLELVPAL